METMQAVSFMYVRPPGYNAESAKAAEIEDEKRRKGQVSTSQDSPAPAMYCCCYYYCLWILAFVIIAFAFVSEHNGLFVCLLGIQNLCLWLKKRKNLGQKMFLDILYRLKKNLKFLKMLHGMVEFSIDVPFSICNIHFYALLLNLVLTLWLRQYMTVFV